MSPRGPRRRGDGDRSFGDGGFGAYALGGIVGGLEYGFQFRPDGVGLDRFAMSGLDLAQYMGFADDLAVERTGHREQVAHRRFTGGHE
jgi:hypothetical protein